MRGVYYGGFHEDPPTIVALVLDSGCWKESKHICGKNKNSVLIDTYESIAMAALNMVYEAQALGIDSCLLTPSQKVVSEILKIKKPDVCPLMVGFGYEKNGAFQKKRERHTINRLVSYEYMGGKK